jgi:hypothetical protein
MLPFSFNLQAKQPLNEKGKVIFEVYTNTQTEESINLNNAQDKL